MSRLRDRIRPDDELAITVARHVSAPLSTRRAPRRPARRPWNRAAALAMSEQPLLRRVRRGRASAAQLLRPDLAPEPVADDLDTVLPQNPTFQMTMGTAVGRRSSAVTTSGRSSSRRWPGCSRSPPRRCISKEPRPDAARTLLELGPRAWRWGRCLAGPVPLVVLAFYGWLIHATFSSRAQTAELAQRPGPRLIALLHRPECAAAGLIGPTSPAARRLRMDPLGSTLNGGGGMHVHRTAAPNRTGSVVADPPESGHPSSAGSSHRDGRKPDPRTPSALHLRASRPPPPGDLL